MIPKREIVSALLDILIMIQGKNKLLDEFFKSDIGYLIPEEDFILDCVLKFALVPELEKNNWQSYIISHLYSDKIRKEELLNELCDIHKYD